MLGKRAEVLGKRAEVLGKRAEVRALNNLARDSDVSLSSYNRMLFMFHMYTFNIHGQTLRSHKSSGCVCKNI